MRKNSNDMQSEDRSAFSSIGGGKISDAQKKNDMMAFDYENLSSPGEDNEEEKKEITEGRIYNDNQKTKRISDYGKIVVQEQFPDSDKEDDENEECSESIDEGFLQVASAGSCTNTGSGQDGNNNSSSNNQDEAAMFSFSPRVNTAGEAVMNASEQIVADTSYSARIDDASKKQQSVTQELQNRQQLMQMHRQFEDRTNKMRMDLLSMKKTAATAKEMATAAASQAAAAEPGSSEGSAKSTEK